MTYEYLASVYDDLMTDYDYDACLAWLESQEPGYRNILEMACGFRVIIVIEANSYVNIRSSRLLPKFKTQKSSGCCAA